MTDGFVDWWRRQRRSTPRYGKIAYVARMSQVPELPNRRIVVLVGAPQHPKWLVFVCPCGHAHRIALNLADGREPNWTIETNAGRVTVRPSIDSVTPERRCHFWLRRGKVEWAEEAAVSR